MNLCVFFSVFFFSLIPFRDLSRNRIRELPKNTFKSLSPSLLKLWVTDSLARGRGVPIVWGLEQERSRVKWSLKHYLDQCSNFRVGFEDHNYLSGDASHWKGIQHIKGAYYEMVLTEMWLRWFLKRRGKSGSLSNIRKAIECWLSVSSYNEPKYHSCSFRSGGFFTESSCVWILHTSEMLQL